MSLWVLALALGGCLDTQGADNASETHGNSARNRAGDEANQGDGSAAVINGQNEGQCLAIPPASQDVVAFQKAPYLQYPRLNGMTIAFETNVATIATVVVYQDDANCPLAVVQTQPTQMDTYIADIDFDMPAPGGYQHHAEVTGLESGAYYQYVVRIGVSETTPRTFRTTPDSQSTFTALIHGDNRTHDEDHQRVIEAMVPHVPDLTVNTGDMMTAGGIPEDWDGFFAIEHELLSESPMMPTFGNHEQAFGHAYYRGYFRVPSPFDDSFQDYAFAYGASYWIALNSNSRVEGQRLEWLQEQLTESQNYPFRFIFFHHPFYTFSKHVPDLTEREKLHPLFHESGVNAVWNGHNHCYERFVVDDIFYVVTGGGGASLYSIDSYVVPDEEPLRVAAESTHHFVILSVTPEEATALVWDVDNEKQLDEFIMKPNR
jgi:hypothetical protein